jgi:hypothetical protein
MKTYENFVSKHLQSRFAVTTPPFGLFGSGGSVPSNRMLCLSFILEWSSVMAITAERDSSHPRKGNATRTAARKASAWAVLFKIKPIAVEKRDA